MKLKFFLITVMFGLFGQSYACKCGGPGTIKESFKNNELIVYGKAKSLETVQFSETIKETDVAGIREKIKEDKQKNQYFEMLYVSKIELEIIEKYKGENIRKTIVIYTPVKSASCGYIFEKGKEYIVYASGRNFLSFLFQKETEGHEKDNTFWTNHCSRTTEYLKSEADELGLLKNKIN